MRKLPDGIVSVCSDENNAVNIACGNADYNISGTASDDFPDLPSLDYCSNLSLPQDTMARMIAETSFAISTNESRPVYTGALIEVDDNIMTMVAVDGYRMALRREPVETCDVESLKFIVPGAALSDLEKICMSPEEPVKIAVGSKRLVHAVRVAAVLSLGSSAVSALLAFYLTFVGAYSALTPVSMLLYLLLWALAALIEGFWADRY